MRTIGLATVLTFVVFVGLVIAFEAPRCASGSDGVAMGHMLIRGCR